MIRKCDRPRAAIFASRNLQLWPMQDYTDGDLVTCLWKLQGGRGREVIVASAYLDITLQAVISEKLDKLLTYCSHKNLELMLCEDTNAHSNLWGCEDTN